MRVNLTAREFRVLLCIIRNSYGRGSKSVSISYGEIEKQTGIKRQNIPKVISKLSLTGITSVIDGDYTFKNTKKVFEINKDYEQWGDKSVIDGDYTTDDQSVIDGDYKSVIDVDYTKKSTPFIQKKKEIKKINKRKCRRESDFHLFWSEYPLKKGKKQAMKTWDKLAQVPKEDCDALPDIEKIVSSIKSQKVEKKQLREQGEFCPKWKHPSTWLNAGCWDDETECEVEGDDDLRSRYERVARKVFESDRGTRTPE